jgi:NAD+ diphosphatase
MHTALAGFVEAGETFEKAVAREVYEETGVRIDKDSVNYIGSQPWPFPQSIMIGFFATATADDTHPLNVHARKQAHKEVL